MYHIHIDAEFAAPWHIDDSGFGFVENLFERIIQRGFHRFCPRNIQPKSFLRDQQAWRMGEHKCDHRFIHPEPAIFFFAPQASLDIHQQ